MKPIVLGDHPAIVYLIATSENGPTKIGVTTNLQQRLADLQIGCWDPLKVFSTRLAIFRYGHGKRVSRLADFREAAYAVESTTISVAREMGHGMMGEWVRCSPAKTLTIATHCAIGRGAGLFSLEDFAALDIGWAEPVMLRAKARIVQSLSRIATFAVAHNEQWMGLDS